MGGGGGRCGAFLGPGPLNSREAAVLHLVARGLGHRPDVCREGEHGNLLQGCSAKLAGGGLPQSNPRWT